MKKQYITPETLIAQINTGVTILTSSPGGVTTGSALGDEYTGTDVTYSRRRRRHDDWDDEDEWEDEEY